MTPKELVGKCELADELWAELNAAIGYIAPTSIQGKATREWVDSIASRLQALAGDGVDYQKVLALLEAGGYIPKGKTDQAIWILHPELRDQPTAMQAARGEEDPK